MTLQAAHQHVTRPTETGIIHIGLGQFAKAHLGVYTDHLVQQGQRQWGIVGLSLRNPSEIKRLAAQNWLYSVLAESEQGHNLTVVGALRSGLSLSEHGPDKILGAFLDPNVRVVTMTLTEKGYYQGGDGELDLSHPDIQHDIEHVETPVTALGWLVLGLKKRFDKNLPAFTPLALDNLSGNGRVLKRMVITLARQTDVNLAHNIEDKVPFPSTMVDRIVPAVDKTTRVKIEALLGAEDIAGVATEQFCQWVIEDNFVAGRPDWDMAGAVFCDEVAPFEQAKLRMLNGTHSALAYLGCLLGLETVADCMSDQMLQRFLRDLMTDEIMPEVLPPKNFNLEHYRDDLFRRFQNPHLRHRCEQIAMDGSQKIPQRILPVIEARLDRGASIDKLVLVVSAWIQFVRQTTDLSDPLSERLRAIITNTENKHLGERFVCDSGVFPASLCQSDRFLKQLQDCLDGLDSRSDVVNALKNTAKIG